MKEITILLTLFSLGFCSAGQVKDEAYYLRKIEELKEEKTKVEKYRVNNKQLATEFAYGFADIGHNLAEKKALRKQWISYMKKKYRGFSEPRHHSCFFFKVEKPLVTYNHFKEVPARFMTDKYMLCRAIHGTRFGDAPQTYLFAITNKNIIEQVRFSSFKK